MILYTFSTTFITDFGVFFGECDGLRVEFELDELGLDLFNGLRHVDKLVDRCF